MKVFLKPLVATVLSSLLAVLAACGNRFRALRLQLKRLQKRLDIHRFPVRERVLIDSVEDLIWLKDLRGRYVMVNQAFLDHYRKPRQEIEGYSDSELFSPELAESYGVQDQRALAQASPLRVEEKVEGPRPSWYETVLTPIRDDHGILVGLAGISRDITERKLALHRLDEFHDRLTWATRAGKFGVWDWDVANDRLKWNEQMFVLYGMKPPELPEEVVGSFETWAAAVLPEDLHAAKAEVEAALKGVREFSTQFRVRWPDGSVRCLRGAAKVQHDAEGNAIRMIGMNWDVTDQVDTLRALEVREQEQRQLLEILDSAQDLIALVDSGCHLIYLNNAGRQMLGFGRNESLTGVKLRDLYCPDVDSRMLEDLLLRADKCGHADAEIRFRARSGNEIPASQVIAAHRDADGRITHYSIIARDIREYKRLLEHHRLSDKVFTCTAEAIMITDSNNRIVSVNEAFTTITGYTLEEVKEQDPAMFSAGREDPAFFAEMRHAIDTVGHWEGELWDKRKDGSIYPKWLNINAVKDPGSEEVSHYIGIFSDISQRKQQEDYIRHLAFHDVLTGLPNRSLFQDRLRQALAESRRNDVPIALMLLDLDHFKYVNDTLGHHVGDQLIKEVAARLVGCVREIDTVARLGGDEFVIIINGMRDLRDVVLVAEKISSEMAQPMLVHDRQFRVTTSLGISMYPGDADNIDDLMRNADTAMYYAKDKGRDNYQFFTPHLNEAAHERLLIEEHLRRGLEQGEFELFYQPKVSLGSRKLVGCEALLRWNHPDWGMVLPDRFIPIAEDSGLILPLGEWVIDEVCRQARQWGNCGLKLQVAVNLSGRQFRDASLIVKIRKVLENADGMSRWMELEITESTLIEGASRAAQTLHDLHVLSLPLAVDDFGTGYSSLSYLKTFAIDTLKIDKSFVDGIDRDPNDVTIVRAVISLAHQLGIKVVAEGVEDVRQLRFLENLHCDMIQGYYFSPPLRADEFVAYARREFPLAFTT